MNLDIVGGRGVHHFPNIVEQFIKLVLLKSFGLVCLNDPENNF